MKLLLDTHVILWALEDSTELPISIRDLICDERNEIYISTASLWEIAIKHKKSPEKMIFNSRQIRDYCQRSGYIFLSLSVDNVSTYDDLDLKANQDPFDQILACQAYSNNMVLLTHDKRIGDYNLSCVKCF